MPTLYNLEPWSVIIAWNEDAVFPGESYEFTDEQVSNGITGQWSETDPRAGLDQEREFKSRRRAEAETGGAGQTDQPQGVEK